MKENKGYGMQGAWLFFSIVVEKLGLSLAAAVTKKLKALIDGSKE